MSNIFYTIGFFLFVLEAVSSCCSDGWTRFGDSCYFFGHDVLTFHDAQHFCEHFNANLVNIESSVENTFISSYLSDLKDPNHWIGLTDELVEGVWKLYPSETTALFFGWQSGQPNEGKGANCAAIWASRNYQWVDEPCTHKFRPLCEKPAEAEVSPIVG